MGDPSRHFRQAHEYLSELRGFGYAIDPEESPGGDYSAQGHRNCLSAIEEPIAAGLVTDGRTPSDGLAAKIDAFRGEYNTIGELDAVLLRWTGFDSDDETVIEQVQGLIDARTEDALNHFRTRDRRP